MQSTFSQLGQGLGREKGVRAEQDEMQTDLGILPISYCQYSNNLNILLHQAKDRACSRVWGGMWTEVGKLEGEGAS